MKLHNQYFGLRHGKSEANEKGIIISHPDNGILYYGLVEEGKEQVKKSVSHAKKQGILHENILVISSPFKRCVETAEIAQEILGVNGLLYREELQERNFGKLEKSSNAVFNYISIWDKDAKNPHHTHSNVESIVALQKRMLGFIEELEKIYVNKTILLVSHGDPLHVVEAGLKGIDLTKYRTTIPCPENGKIRKLHG